MPVPPPRAARPLAGRGNRAALVGKSDFDAGKCHIPRRSVRGGPLRDRVRLNGRSALFGRVDAAERPVASIALPAATNRARVVEVRLTVVDFFANGKAKVEGKRVGRGTRNRTEGPNRGMPASAQRRGRYTESLNHTQAR